MGLGESGCHSKVSACSVKGNLHPEAFSWDLPTLVSIQSVLEEAQLKERGGEGKATSLSLWRDRRLSETEMTADFASST